MCWWGAGALFHAAFGASFGGWASSPFHHAPTLRPLWDPHAFDAAAGALGGGGALQLSSSGAFTALLSIGFASEAGPQRASLGLALAGPGTASSASLAGPGSASPACFARPPLAACAGALSLLWAGHTQARACAEGPGARSGGLDPCTSAILAGDVMNQHVGAGGLLLWGPSGRGLGGAQPLSLVGGARAPQALRSPLSPRSSHFRLRFLLAPLGSLSSLAAQHAAAMPAFLFFRAAGHGGALLFAHHTCAGGPLSLGAGTHAAIFLVRAARAAGPGRALAGGASEHLSWVSLWLGFHVLGAFVHNDSACAAAAAAHQLLFRPALGERAHAAAGAALFSSLGPGDFLAHHAIALGLHTSTLVLAKGAARGRASRHMPDKAAHGFGFACDGPGRGGSCDVSGWDSAYLALFWVLNTAAWALFYAHWKRLGRGFLESSRALLGWFRDYLWHPCAALVRGYGLLGADEAAPAAWAFLLAHLCWAAGPMPLASWRGYWQEVIDIFAYLHLRAPALSSLWQARVSPAALGIVQARAVGAAHFACGLAGAYYCFVA